MSTEDKNNLQFTAGNNLTGIFKLYHEAMMQNELRNGLGAYELSFAGGESGFSFGGNQIDLSQNMDFAKNVVEILKNATDNKGVSFFTPDEVLNIAGKDNTNLTQSQKTLESTFGDNLPKIQAALSSQYGINTINEIYLHEVESSAKHIEAATAKMQNPAAKAFYETDVGKLLLFDYNNQFYIDLDGAFLKKYIDGVFNEDAKVVYSTGEEITAPIDTYTIEDHKAFIYSTKQYAENPDDCIRRLKNLDAIIENYFNHPEQYLSPEELAAAQAENKEGEAIEVAVDFAIVKVAKGKWKILDDFELPKFVIPPPQGKVVAPQNTFITYSNPLVLVVPSNSPLKGVSDFYYYFAEDKRLIHIAPSGPFVPPLGDNSNWSLPNLSEKPRRSGRGWIARTATPSFMGKLMRCLLLLDILSNDCNGRPSATSSKVARRPQCAAP